VDEEQLAGGREDGARAAADEERGAELALEGADLVRHGRLAAGQRRRRPRERAVPRDRSEGQEPARILHARNLSICLIQNAYRYRRTRMMKSCAPMS